MAGKDRRIIHFLGSFRRNERKKEERMERQTEGIVEKIGRERTVAGTDQGSSGKLLFTVQATPRVSEKSLQKQIELKLYTKLC